MSGNAPNEAKDYNHWKNLPMILTFTWLWPHLENIQFTTEQCSLQLLECETNDEINDVIQSEEGAIVSHIGWPTGKKFNVSIHVMI